MTLLLQDRELLDAFREGRRAALERVYRHYVTEVATFLKRGFTYTSASGPTTCPGLQRPSDLDNAIQDVFVRAFEPRTRGAYDGLRPYRFFLLGIARNVAFKELERRAVQGARHAPVEDVEETLAAPPPAAEETIHARRGREVVGAFLAQCGEQDRRLVALRYDEGLSLEATGRAAGLTKIQVRRWDAKFRARLERYLRRMRYLEVS